MPAGRAGVLSKPAAAAGGGSPYTLNPSLNSGKITSVAYSADGYTWANARAGDAGGSGGKATETGGYYLVGQEYQFFPGDTYSPSSEGYFVHESFLDFNLSSVVGTVSSADLSLGLFADASDVDFTVEARTHAWGVSLENADFVAGGSLSGLTLLATLATSGIGGAGYKLMSQNGTALKDAVIATKPGVLRIVLASSRTRLNNNSSSAELVQFEPHNHATLKPKLVVVTT